ncbi:MAG: PBP1A family penicillin-binding protein [Gemmatimonadetes bacterium]|nr:PBP1A family penicillin-binding protein [Gemmatimonadota bacterium]
MAANRRTWKGLRHRLARLPRPSRHQAVAAGLTLAVLGVVAWERCGVRGCPDVRTLAAYQPDGAPQLLDREGKPFARLRPVDRVVVPLDSVPEVVREAFVSVEDRRFRGHRGVDWLRVPGALWANVRAGGVREGFSTITMQLARNVFPDRLPARERSPLRKLLEMRVAGAIEDHFTKDEILELYLNHIYFGDGVHGIAAASRHYFDKPPPELTLREAALLAALPKGPATYHPRRHPERARARRDLVLTLMERQGRSAPEDAAVARETSLGVTARPPHTPREEEEAAPYFIEAVRRVLEERLGPDVYATRLRVHTTLDRSAQAAVEDALQDQLRRIEAGAYGRVDAPRFEPGRLPSPEGSPHLQAAAVILEAATGDVLALVGGRDYDDSAFDRAILGRRQLGSAFKPFLYAAAIEGGAHPATLLSDSPYQVELAGGRVYRPANFDGDYRGQVTMREALVRSLNVPAVRTAMHVGVERVTAAAREAGFQAEGTGPAVALGAAEASPLQVASAYTVFATLGTRASPRLVTRVVDETGRELWRTAPATEPVMDPGIAFIVTDMMRDVVDRGTGQAARRWGFRGPLAGKTGTTDDGRDAWFVGLTPEMVAAVWLGFDQPRRIVARASGGTLAAPVLGRALARLDDERPGAAPWVAPPSVVRLRFDPETGIVLNEGCDFRGGREEYFLQGALPARGCPQQPRRQRGFFDRVGGWISDLLGGGDDEPRRPGG